MSFFSLGSHSLSSAGPRSPQISFCCWYTCRCLSCISSYPSPNAIPGELWLSSPHFYMYGQYLCILPVWPYPISTPVHLLFMFMFKFCHVHRPPALDFLPSRYLNGPKSALLKSRVLILLFDTLTLLRILNSTIWCHWSQGCPQFSLVLISVGKRWIHNWQMQSNTDLRQ